MGNGSIHAVTMVDQTRKWFMGSNLDSQSNSEIAVARATIIGRICGQYGYENGTDLSYAPVL